MILLAGVSASLTLGSGAAVAQATDEPGLPVKALAKSCDLGFMPDAEALLDPPVAVVNTLGATRTVGAFVVDQSLRTALRLG